MLNVSDLKAEMVRNGFTHGRLAKELGLASRSIGRKMKSGEFSRSEIEKIIELLHLKNPTEIFFAKEKATHAAREQEQPNLNRVSEQLANPKKCECKIVDWNPDEEMTKEFALSALKEIKLFYRRLYNFPEMKPFINDKDFDGATQVLNGLSKLIETKVTE